MNYAFYITNHGFGHASRNVPIIKRLLTLNKDNKIFVKSDCVRCDFLKRNFSENENMRIRYFADCNENGLILEEGGTLPDVKKMKSIILDDFNHWPDYIEREKDFLKCNSINMVVADVICWAIKAAHDCSIKTLLIGNFTWSQMYKSFYTEEIWGRYEEYYKLADKAVWYEIHSYELHKCCENYELVSLVSRSVNWDVVNEIKKQYNNKKIVFVSLGASAEINNVIDVESLPYVFLTTRGINLCGSNVHKLPLNMINTPDYIAASDYIIAKGGWSTVAEILLQKKKSALLMRGLNSEDNNTKNILQGRKQAVAITQNELADIRTIIKRIDKLEPDSFDDYKDDTERICDIINKVAM